MIKNPNVFIATAVNRVDDHRKPTITIHKNPLQEGKYIATFESTDCDEIVNGYSYDELLSIRNAINEALTAIDVKETVHQFNQDFKKHTYYD
jgi:hypothetical protein